jgi:hypothetical protein
MYKLWLENLKGRCYLVGGPGSVDGIATGYGMDGPRI